MPTVEIKYDDKKPNEMDRLFKIWRTRSHATNALVKEIERDWVAGNLKLIIDKEDLT